MAGYQQIFFICLQGKAYKPQQGDSYLPLKFITVFGVRKDTICKYFGGKGLKGLRYLHIFLFFFLFPLLFLFFLPSFFFFFFLEVHINKSQSLNEIFVVDISLHPDTVILILDGKKSVRFLTCFYGLLRAL